MWHDDEGDDAEGSGDLPDPSTRHWRHPSELNQHRALPHRDPTPIIAAPATSSSGAVWPLVAVGGCLAIAALGVIGLRTDLRRADSLQAGTAATVVPTQTTFRNAAALAAETTSSAPGTSIQRARPVPGDDPADGATTATSLGQPSNGSNPDQRTQEGPASRSSDLLESPSLGEVAKVPVYGVYAAPGRDESQLGSFIMIGDDPVASSSSIGVLNTVWLRVETEWVAARVVATDPISDVALLALIEEVEVDLPGMVLADGPADLGDPAMVGYGDPEALSAGDGSEGDGTDNDPDQNPERNRGQEGDQGGDADGDQGGDTERKRAEKLDEADRVWAEASDRRGVIYSLTKPLTTGSGRLVHDPIRLNTVPDPADAGAPLRNRDGEVIGLVAHSPLPQVAAVPIDRVVDVVAWLHLIGVGNPAWLGVTVTPSPGGLIVASIDDAGPSGALAPGDLIIAVDGELVVHPDSLVFAARTAGPGQTIDVVVDRQNRRQVIQIEVGSVPPT